MADRKRRRVTDDELAIIRRVLHTGGITASGLHELLEALRGTDLQNAGVHSIRLANTEDFLNVRLACQLPLRDGGSWCWELADPIKLLQVAIARSAFLRGLFSAAVRRSRPSPSTPWRLVVGFDEFMPG